MSDQGPFPYWACPHCGFRENRRTLARCTFCDNYKSDEPTPGPWTLNGTCAVDNFTISAQNSDAPGGEIVIASLCNTWACNAANAALIAAAPEFAEAYRIVADRLASVTLKGGGMQEFLDAGSLRELAAVYTKAMRLNRDTRKKT